MPRHRNYNSIASGEENAANFIAGAQFADEKLPAKPFNWPIAIRSILAISEPSRPTAIGGGEE
jgi:hypothetical protein